MSGQLRFFNQNEYSSILNEHGGHQKSHTQCIKILIEHGASHAQAKNGAYTYLHHGDHLTLRRRCTQEEYNQILDRFNGVEKNNMECIRHLENLGFSQGQAKSAAHKYRQSKELINQRSIEIIDS